jgi:hypothetical protein
MSRVEVPHFQPFVGHHCETVATGTPPHDAAQRCRRVADIEVSGMRPLAGI